MIEDRSLLALGYPDRVRSDNIWLVIKTAIEYLFGNREFTTTIQQFEGSSGLKSPNHVGLRLETRIEAFEDGDTAFHESYESITITDILSPKSAIIGQLEPQVYSIPNHKRIYTFLIEIVLAGGLLAAKLLISRQYD